MFAARPVFYSFHILRDMATFERLDATERALAMPDPSRSGNIVPGSSPLGSPIEALRTIVRPYVLAGPCYVLFSGGRDSSAVLAVAMSVAREAGVSPPIPITGVHPDVPESDEADWQDYVLRHLNITERHVIALRGEQSLLAPATQQSLARHGLLWPPATHVQGPYIEGLVPGSVLSGEGGDAVITDRRITPMVKAIRGLKPRRALRALRKLRESSRTRAAASEGFLRASPWLTSEGARAARTFVARARPEALRWSVGLRQTAFCRPAAMARVNFLQFFRERGFQAEDPLDHPHFVASLARAGGFIGLGSRTDMMRYLFLDYLPDSVLARETKASFNGARWTGREVRFAQDWSGNGVDTRLIDPDRLRQAWLSDEPPVLSDLHLHAAWLADHGLPLVPDDA